MERGETIMRDFDMRRRPRPVFRSRYQPSRRDKRRRGERLLMLFTILVFAIICIAAIIHGRWRSEEPPPANRTVARMSR